MKLLADVNVSLRVVVLLRDRGHDVVRVGEVMDARAPDEEILGHAIRTGRVVVSQDQDFSALLARSGGMQPSLINLRLSDVEPDAIARLIDAVLTRLSEDLAKGAIVAIDDGGVRVRRLPVGY